MKFKIRKHEESVVNIKTISGRHAVFGEIVTPKDCYSPCFVLHSYFEQQYIEKYGYDSEELLKHGTGYIDCLDRRGKVLRLQFYEYVIIVHGKRISERFRKKISQLDDENGFSYEVMHFIAPSDDSVTI